MSPKDIQVVGRVAVARGLRLDAPSKAPSAPAAAAEPRDVACPRCGAVLCEAARRPLFAGMVLACNRCSEKTRVDRA